MLEAQIRECYGRVVYSTKAHEKAADRCSRKLSRVKWTQIALAAITTGGLISVFFGEAATNFWAMIISATCSTLQLLVNIYSKDVDPGKEAESHKITAVELWNIRESYLSLLTDLHEQQLDLSTIKAQRDPLQLRLAEIYKTAPRTTVKDYQLSQTALKSNEEMTFSSKEIDQLLPEALRKNI